MLKQLEPVIEKIGDNTFAITPFPAFRAANMTGELASVLAPLAGILVPLMNASGGDTDAGNGLFDIDVKEAVDALSGCGSLSGDKVEALMKKLLLGGHITAEFEEDGRRKNEKLNQDLADELFCGNVQDMFALCFHVIRLNFNGFFKRLAAQSGPEKPEGQKQRPIY